MNRNLMDALIKKELEMIPKGEPGHPQNIFRAIYNDVKRHDLSVNPDRHPSKTFQKALEQVRQNYHDFIPTVTNGKYFDLQ